MALTDTPQTVRPPADYHPDGLTAWLEDDLDPFFTPLGERPWVADPAAGPTPTEVRAVYEGRWEVNRVVSEGDGYRWAPPVRNSGTLGQVRPTSPDRVTVDPADSLHFKAWAHLERRRWAQGQIRTAEQTRQMEAARPRCPICGALLATSAPAFRPWSKGKGLCGPCAEAVNLAGAQDHLAAHQAAISGWLETQS